MATQRTKIRRAIVKLLKGQTDAGEKVFPNRATPFSTENLPSISVQTLSEVLDDQDTAPREYKRNLTVVIECVVRGNEDHPGATKRLVDERLDDLMQQVEDVLELHDTISCTADHLKLTGVEMELRGEGQMIEASGTMTWDVMYHTFAPSGIDKQDGIGKFKTANVKYHVGHDDDDPDLSETEAEDTVDIDP